MIKLVTFLKRRPELTRAAFAERWLTIHAPLAAVFPGLRGYMLSFPEGDDPAEPSADGVAQLWFDSEEAAQDSYATDVGRQGSKDASSHLTRRDHLFASERWITAPASLADLPFKLLVAGKRIQGQSRKAFAGAWEDAATQVAANTSARAVRACVDRRGKMLSSGTEGPLTLRDAEPVHDGLIEMWCGDANALHTLALSADIFRETLAPIADNLEILALREHVIVRPPVPAYGMEA